MNWNVMVAKTKQWRCERTKPCARQTRPQLVEPPGPTAQPKQHAALPKILKHHEAVVRNVRGRLGHATVECPVPSKISAWCPSSAELQAIHPLAESTCARVASASA